MDHLLNHAPCGFLSFADDRTILHANATLGKWLGYEPEELVGRSIESILTIGGRIFCQTHIFPLLKLQGQVEEIYFSLQTRRRETLPVLTSASRRPDGAGFANDCVFLPMRQRREYEDELLQARKTADDANQAKARFLSMMSHELRTPMNAILGFGQLLAVDDLKPKQLGSVQHILKAGKHLLELINEVLDLSRIEAGRLDISLAPTPVAEVMSEAFEMARPLAAGSGIRLHLLPGACDRGYVRADAGRLRQMLLNLLANGIKYNRPGGSVTLTCQPAAGDGPGKLRFVVCDTGAGIAPEKLAQLFTPFERLGAEGGTIEGTGLGLAVCKRLAEAMEGAVGVDSVGGEGSSFWVELPLAPAPAAVASGSAEEAPAPVPAGPQAAVLYIEDIQSNRALVAGIFDHHRAGVRLACAETGQAGLDLARAEPPDLILLDLQLPDLSGSEVLAQLRADACTRDIPVVVLSADATARETKRLLDAGARDYLTKPLDVKVLLRVVDALLEEAAAGLVPV